MTSLATPVRVAIPPDSSHAYNFTAAAAAVSPDFAPKQDYIPDPASDTNLKEGIEETTTKESIDVVIGEAPSADTANLNTLPVTEGASAHDPAQDEAATKNGGRLGHTTETMKEESAVANTGADASIPMYSAMSESSIHDQNAPSVAASIPSLAALAPLPDFSQMGNFDAGLNGMHLPNLYEDINLLGGMNGMNGMEGFQGLGGPFDIMPQDFEDPPVMAQETRVSAYAKLVFPDGEFYMNTYSIILGRDKVATRAAHLDKLDQEKLLEGAGELRNPNTPRRNKPTGNRSRYSRSLVSESGGILRDKDDSDEERVRRRKSRKGTKKSKSSDSSLKHASRRNSMIHPSSFYQPPQPHPTFTAPVDVAPVIDPATLRPSPKECPTISIHPPAQDAATGKSISRQHVKIGYNVNKHLFEATILGRNGIFVDEKHYHQHDVVPLNSGSMLQIGTLEIQFVLPDVAIGSTGAELQADYDDDIMTDRYTEGGKSMSFDFEDGERKGISLRDTSEEASVEISDMELREHEHGDIEEVGEMIQEREEEQEEYDGLQLRDSDRSEPVGIETKEGVRESFEPRNVLETTRPKSEKTKSDKHKSEKPKTEKPKSEKKRGPGRPPKDGVMSKREQKLAKKEALAREMALAEEAAQAAEQVIDPLLRTVTPRDDEGDDGEEGASGDGQEKNKVGRPRKHPKPDSPDAPREKRKYTKRKPKDPADPNVKEDGSADDKDKPTKEKKAKKPKPPRSPTPTFVEAELTADQLAKPAANYVQLIHEALSESDKGSMTLPQIYRAIQRKYPYFVCKTSTIGWQSSVRHNLSQHNAFQKDERDGKGYKWSIVQGVPVEKEKKRKISPSPQMPNGYQHPIYPGYPPHMMQYSSNMMGQPPQAYPHAHPGYPPPPPHMSGYAPQHGLPPHMAGYPPGYFPPPPPTVPLAPTGGSYSSPYAPKQPVPPPPPPLPVPQAPLPGPSYQPGQTVPLVPPVSLGQPAYQSAYQSAYTSQPPHQGQPAPAVTPTQAVQPSQNGQPVHNGPPSQAGQLSQNGQPVHVASNQAPQPLQNGHPVSGPSNQASQLLQNGQAVQNGPSSQVGQPSHTVPTVHHGPPAQIGQLGTTVSALPPQPPQPATYQPSGPQQSQRPSQPQLPPVVKPHSPKPVSQSTIIPPPATALPPPMNPKPNERVRKIIESFKGTMISSLKGKSNNPEAVVEAAANRLLGKGPQSSGDPEQEEIIYTIMAKTLSSVPGVNFQLPANVSQSYQNPSQTQSYTSTNHNPTQDGTAQNPVTLTGPQTSGATIMRPSSSVQPNGLPRPPSISRPPLAVPGGSEPDSASSANANITALSMLPTAMNKANGNAVAANAPAIDSTVSSALLVRVDSKPELSADLPATTLHTPSVTNVIELQRDLPPNTMVSSLPTDVQVEGSVANPEISKVLPALNLSLDKKDQKRAREDDNPDDMPGGKRQMLT